MATSLLRDDTIDLECARVGPEYRPVELYGSVVELGWMWDMGGYMCA